MHPLYGPWVKIKRAESHLNSLQGMCAGYRDTNPVKVQGGFDAQVGKFRLGFLARPSVPDCIPATVGDLVHNLRSALDHLVTQLVIANKRKPSGKESFPILKNPMTKADFLECTKDRIGKCSATAKDVIEALQPYHGGQRAVHHALWLVRELDRIDKHRRINIVAMRYRMIYKPGTTGFSIGGIDLGPIISGEAIGLFSDQVEVGVFDTDEESGGNFEPDVKFEFDLAFADNEGPCPRQSIDVLETAVEYVRLEVMPRFTGFFAKPFDPLDLWKPNIMPPELDPA